MHFDESGVLRLLESNGELECFIYFHTCVLGLLPYSLAAVRSSSSSKARLSLATFETFSSCCRCMASASDAALPRSSAPSNANR
eukprot:12931812-Prorocentrum_lima.AAC.1